MSWIELFLSGAELFLADRISGSSGVGEVRNTAAFSKTARSSLKKTGARYLACVQAEVDSLVAQLIHILSLDGPRFDSLLPASVKAVLNVNQGPDWEKHVCKQIELRAAR